VGEGETEARERPALSAARAIRGATVYSIVQVAPATAAKAVQVVLAKRATAVAEVAMEGISNFSVC
jgi:hypothetical protein